jgi:hypothetical protein
MPNNKRELTRRLLEQVDRDLDIEQALLSWYVNIRPTGGLRLTPIGYTVLKTLELESWSIDLSANKPLLSKKLLLELDHKLQWPYYIDGKQKKLILFSSREAMLANLYGDLQAFLKQYS